MIVTDELLMAYADGELDVDTRAAVEREISRSPDLAGKLERHLALKAHIKSAFDPVLSEPIPDRLKSAIDRSPSSGGAAVSDIAEARAKERRRGAFASPLAWMSMAASVAMGVLIGYLSFNGGEPNQVMARNGRIVDSTLRGALDQATASNSDDVHLGVSYLTKGGDYCRSFITIPSGDAQSLAGVACHSDAMPNGEWRVRMLMTVERSGDANFRTAASDLPAAVLELIDREIQGEPLDADGEAAAIAKRWKR